MRIYRYNTSCCTEETNCCGGERNFLTNEEKIKKLETYKEWLDKESQGVSEAIDKINKAS